MRYGSFELRDSVSVPQLEDAFRYGYWQRLVYPIDIVLLHWAAIVVSDTTASNIRQGRALVLENDGRVAPKDYLERHPQTLSNHHCRAYTLDGRLLSVICFDSERGQWRPEKVFM